MQAILGRQKAVTPCIAQELYMSLAIESKPDLSISMLTCYAPARAPATPSQREQSYHSAGFLSITKQKT